MAELENLTANSRRRGGSDYPFNNVPVYEPAALWAEPEAFYWSFPTVPVPEIADALGLPPTFALSVRFWRTFVIQGAYTMYDCLDCTEPVVVKSRQHWRRLVTTVLEIWDEPDAEQVNEAFLYEAIRQRHPILCIDCERRRGEAREQQNRETWRQQEAERTATLVGLRALPYEEYLRTEHWLKTAQRARRAADYKCQLCNRADSELHVHHRTYERLGEEYLKDLIVLCEECHRRFHNKLVGIPT